MSSDVHTKTLERCNGWNKIVEGAKNMVKGAVDTAVNIAPAIIGVRPGIVAAKAVKNMLNRSAEGKPNKKGCSYKR